MKLTFQNDSAFTQELKSEVKQYLSRNPGGRLADRGVWVKAIIFLSTSTCLYLTLLLARLTYAEQILVDILFSLSTLFLGLNVMHEAVHGNFSSKPAINKIMALTFDLYGISSDLYLIKHTQFHHNYTNIYELDGDINEAPLIRMTEKQPWMPAHRFQLIYTPLLYSLITITWMLFDIGRLISAKVGTRSFRRPNLLTTLKILFMKAVSVTLTYILPIQMLGWHRALPLILIFHLGLGLVLALIFQVAHVHEDAIFNESQITTDWFQHQIKTSADFSTRNKLMIWLCGGLNFQTIHHLFPNVSYRHYPQIREILTKLCQKHSIRYVEFESFSNAVQVHFELLQKLGKKQAS